MYTIALIDEDPPSTFPRGSTMRRPAQCSSGAEW
jgi:hypothetical protein